MSKFTLWHLHDIYSVRDGMIKPSELVKFCNENNLCPIITNHGSIGSWFTLNKESKKNNMKIGYGCEFYINKFRKRLFEVLDEIKTEKDKDKKVLLNKERDNLKSEIQHIVIVAKNQTGFYNITKMHNEAWKNGFYNRPMINYDSFNICDKDENGSYGLIISTACLGGPIGNFVRQKNLKAAKNYIEEMKEIFGDDFYLEVQANNIDEQKLLNKTIIKLAEKTNTKILIGLDAHFVGQDDASTHEDLLLLQNKQKKKDVGVMINSIVYENKKGEIKTKNLKEDCLFFDTHIDDLSVGDIVKDNTILEINQKDKARTFSTDQVYLKNEKDIIKTVNEFHKELIPVIDDIIKNHYELYDKIEEVKFDTEVKLPTFENVDKIVMSIVKERLKELATEKKLFHPIQVYIDRIKYEFDIIKKNEFSGYFYILYDLLFYAREHDIPLGCGRGSSSSSLIAYLLQITRIDPLNPLWGFEDGLPFERFLDANKTLKKIKIIVGGKKYEMTEMDDVKVKRDNEVQIIKAIELQKTDEFLNVHKRFGG